MSKYRRAINLDKPSNQKAVKKANEAVAGDIGGRKLSSSHKDAGLRKKWMDAYIAAGGEYEEVEPSGKKPNKSKVECVEKVQYALVELIEVVTQDTERWVYGAGVCTDDEFLSDWVERYDTDSAGNLKQYINIDKEIEGSDNRHPEYGREITLRARIQRKDGQHEKLSGVKVHFKYKLTPGPNRTNPGGSNPDVWNGPDLADDHKEGFEKPNGEKTVSATTNDKGWTDPPVTFFLSRFGGDRFEISCKLDPKVPGSSGSKPLPTDKEYVVWRKFWYQMTYADGYPAKDPDKAAEAYGQVFAEMIKTNTVEFKKEDLSTDLSKRTFYKKYMFKLRGGTDVVASVGLGNISEFRTNSKVKMTTDPATPVKENLIVCEYQCDPSDENGLFLSDEQIHDIKATSQSITVTGGKEFVCNPCLQAGQNLVVVGEWATVKVPWTKRGNITDTNIDIDENRTDLKDIVIKLPAEAPAPTPANPVYVRLQVVTGKGFLGWADTAGVVAVYQPGTPAGEQCSEEDFNDTVAHELGHKFCQSPEPANQPPGMKNHPLEYVGHGGSGPHCRHGAKVAAGPVNWNDENENVPEPEEGDCVMYHSYSKKCAHKFCKTCKPYLQLQDMSGFLKHKS